MVDRREISVRPARMEDIEAFGFEFPDVRVRAWTGFINGEAVAIGGYWYAPDGSAVAFLNAKQEARDLAKVTLLKTAKMVISDARSRGLVWLRAISEQSNEAAIPFLERLGFQLADAQRGEFSLNLTIAPGGGQVWHS